MVAPRLPSRPDAGPDADERMTDETLRVGARFVHARLLDPDWRPGPGERYADAPHAVCRVTAVRAGRVYYAIGDGRRAHAYFPLADAGSHVAEILPGTDTRPDGEEN